MSGYGGEKTLAIVAETRRRWLMEEKLAMVAETKSKPVSAVARKHGIAASLLFRWRRELGKDEIAAAEERRFVAVALPVLPAAPAGSSAQGALTGVAGGVRLEEVWGGGGRGGWG